MPGRTLRHATWDWNWNDVRRPFFCHPTEIHWRGVAKLIKARTPLCTGDHYPLQPHHCGNLRAAQATLPRTRGHVPTLQPTPLCLPPHAARRRPSSLL